MKIKVKDMMERMECAKRQRKILDMLQPCDRNGGTKLHIESSDAEALEATLEEYEELLCAMIASAEVTI